MAPARRSDLRLLPARAVSTFISLFPQLGKFWLAMSHHRRRPQGNILDPPGAACGASAASVIGSTCRACRIRDRDAMSDSFSRRSARECRLTHPRGSEERPVAQVGSETAREFEWRGSFRTSDPRGGRKQPGSLREYANFVRQVCAIYVRRRQRPRERVPGCPHGRGAKGSRNPPLPRPGTGFGAARDALRSPGENTGIRGQPNRMCMPPRGPPAIPDGGSGDSDDFPLPARLRRPGAAAQEFRHARAA
jgi:hypothetical protein